MRREFRAKFSRNLMLGVFKGFAVAIILVLLASFLELEQDITYLFTIIGVVGGLAYQIITKSNYVIVVDEDSISFGSKNKKQAEFMYANCRFKPKTYTKIVVCLPITTRELIVECNGKIKIMSCSMLDKAEFGEMCAALGQAIEKNVNPNMKNSVEAKQKTEIAGTKRYQIDSEKIANKITSSYTRPVKIGGATVLILIVLMMITGSANGSIQGNIGIMAVFIIVFVAIMVAVYSSILAKSKKVTDNIPSEIILNNTTIFVDGESYAIIDIDKIITTAPNTKNFDDLRKMTIKYEQTEKTYYLGFTVPCPENFQEYEKLFYDLSEILQEKLSVETA